MPIYLSIFVGWISFSGAVFSVSVLFTMLKLVKLNNYLKMNHRSKWSEITKISQFGPGLSNPFRSWPYIFKSEDTMDRALLTLKLSAKKSLRQTLTLFGVFFISIVIGFFCSFFMFQG